jgi:cytochrome c oxidase subunit 3
MSTADAHHDSHDHPPFLAHHFNSPQQQFEAGKLGMWLFLATELLLFGGLFCAYAVYRGNHPEMFAWGSQFLDVAFGGTNTVVLILSSLTMASAVTAAQLNKQKLLVILLSLTFLGGLGFMCIKYVEYKAKFEHGLVWGEGFYKDNHAEGEHAVAMHNVAGVVPATLAQTGLPVSSLPMVVVAQNDDATTVDSTQRSNVPVAPRGPAGMATESDSHDASVHADKPHDAAAHEDDPFPDKLGPDRPANAHIFFGIYFVMTGLHGIHVLVGMAVIAWLLVRAVRGDFSSEYFTPVDLGGLYWHVVDLIWIFLFPLFYLI